MVFSLNNLFIWSNPPPPLKIINNLQHKMKLLIKVEIVTPKKITRDANSCTTR